MLTSGLAFALAGGGVYHTQWGEQGEGLAPNRKQTPLIPPFFGVLLGAPSPISLADSPSPEIREEGRGSSGSLTWSFKCPTFKASLPESPAPLPSPGALASRPPQMAVSQRTVCCRRQGGVPDFRGSGPRLQLGRMGMLSCLQRPRSGRWRALISLHTQRLRSITSSNLPSRSRAGWGGRGSGSGSAGWVCAPSSRRRPRRGEKGRSGGQGPQSDRALFPLRRPVPSPRNKSSLASVISSWLGALMGQKPSPYTLCPAV